MTPGTLQLENEQAVYFQPDRGEVKEIFVKVGDKVKQGDRLLTYENSQLDLEKRQNQLQINSIYLELDKIKNQHRKIDKEVEKHPKDDAIQEEHDQIYLQEQQTNIDLERALLEKESIENRMKDAVISADIDGTVLRVHEDVAKGSQLGEEAMIQIGSLGKVIVEGTISEYDTLHIETGQEVLLTSDAVPDDSWQGEISFISDLPEASTTGMGQEDTSVLYPVKVSLDGDIPLKPGFKMLLEIITKEHTAQTVPIGVVQQQDEESFVFIVEEGKAKRVPVKIGAVNTEYMEIKDPGDLTKKDQIIVDPSDEIKDGMDVTVK